MKEKMKRLLSKSEFNFLLSYECIRSDYSKVYFSLILIKTHKINIRNQLFQTFLKYLFQRMRDLDNVGYYNDHCLGIILPSTSHQNAKLFVDNIINSNCFYVKNLMSVDVYSYPDQWINEYRNLISKKVYTNNTVQQL